MSEPPPPDRPTPLTGGVAGDVPGRLGEDVGRFARLAMRRVERMASAMASAGAATAADAPTPGSATARAEAMIDGAGAQLGTLATLLGHQLRRAAALAREEAEDMWAEAQQIRAAQRRDPE